MIYDQIKNLRTENGFTQTELGKRLGVTRSSVNAWEMGISIPSLQNLVEMARLFRVSVDYMLEIDSSHKISIGHLEPKERQLIISIIKGFEKLHEAKDILSEAGINIDE